MNTPESRSQNATTQHAELWQRMWEPYLRVYRQFTPPSAGASEMGRLQQRYIDFASNEGMAAYQRLSQLSADYYSALLQTGMDLSEKFYRQVYPTKSGGPTPAARPAAPAATRELVFAGPVGSNASRSFVVSNRTAQPAKVSFELSEFVKEGGTEKVRLEAQLTPASFELAGEEERTVNCTLPLKKNLEPGREYRAVLRVIGFPNMAIDLVAKAEPALEKKAATRAKSRPPSKSRRKRKT